MYEIITEYRFCGSHAKRANQLKELGFFSRLVDILAVAPIVGFENARTSERNREDDAEAKVFLAQLNVVNDKLELCYKTIMLLDCEHEPDEESRFRKAFQTTPDQRADEDLERFESYVRGGVDFLFEKLVGSGNTQMDRLIELQDYLEGFASRYSN